MRNVKAVPVRHSGVAVGVRLHQSEPQQLPDEVTLGAEVGFIAFTGMLPHQTTYMEQYLCAIINDIVELELPDA